MRNSSSPAKKPANRRRFSPGEKHGDATREALIGAFSALLESGRTFHEITIADITKAGELTRSGFYFYFANKGEVLAAAAEGARLEMMRAVAPFLDGEDVDAFYDDVGTALRAAAEQWRSRRVLLHAMIEAAVSDPSIDEAWTNWYLSFRDPVCERVQRHVESLGGTVDASRLATITTALLWTNERNFYRAHREPQVSKAKSLEVAATLNELWGAWLERFVSESIPKKRPRTRE